MGKKKSRMGNPTLGLVMLPAERDLVDAYRVARGLDTRSQALRELVMWALGENEAGVSAIAEKLPSSTSVQQLAASVLTER